MKPDIPYTLGYDINKALVLLAGLRVVVHETSTVFQDKKDERKDHIPVVVRQLNEEDCVHLTVAKFQ